MITLAGACNGALRIAQIYKWQTILSYYIYTGGGFCRLAPEAVQHPARRRFVLQVQGYLSGRP